LYYLYQLSSSYQPFNNVHTSKTLFLPRSAVDVISPSQSAEYNSNTKKIT